MAEFDPMAELQHEIRSAAHTAGGLCGFVMGARQSYERGDYGEVNEKLLLRLEIAETKLRQFSYELGRDSRAAREEAKVKELSARMRAEPGRHHDFD